MTMMRLVLAAAVASLIIFATPPRAIAATPTPQPTVVAMETPTATATPASLDLDFAAAPTVSWGTVNGAVEHRLSGTVLAVRVNTADPFCAAPIEQGSLEVPFDITLPSATLSYSVPLPPLPQPDAWFMSTMRAEIKAIDSHGAVIAAGVGGLVAETVCGRLQSLRLPDDEMVQGCVLLPDAVETTSDAARAHGQRTFDEGNGVTRVYVSSDGSCMKLNGALPPIPEFASDVIVSFPGRPARDAAPSSSIRLPQTGYGTGGHHSFGRQLPTLLLGAAEAITMCGAAALRAYRPKCSGAQLRSRILCRPAEAAIRARTYATLY